MLVLTVDCGSSSIKAMLWAQHEFDRPLDWSVVSARTDLHVPVLLASMNQCVQAVLDKYRARGESRPIAHLAMSSFAMSLVGLDEHLSPTTPLYTFASPSPPLSVPLPAHADDLNTKLGIANHALGCYATVHMLASPHARFWTSHCGLAMASWAGLDVRSVPLSFSEASWWGLLDWQSCCWHAHALQRAGVDAERLPRLCDFDQFEGRLGAERARAWPELASAHLHLCVGDGAAATVGSGQPPGKLVVTVGTSAASRVLLPSQANDPRLRPPPRGLFCYRVDRTHVICGGAVSDGGSAVDLALKLCGGDAGVLARADRKPLPGAVVALPFFAPGGERAPGWAGTQAVGGFLYLERDSEPEDLIVAAAVGVSMRLAVIAELLQCPEGPAAVSGGAAAASLLWQRALSGALGGRDLLLDSSGQSTSRGLALLVCGKYTWESDQRDSLKLITHGGYDAQKWQRLADCQVHAYQALKGRI